MGNIQVQCSGEFTLFFPTPKDEYKLFSDLSVFFDAEPIQFDAKHNALYAALYHATEGTCMLLYTMHVKNKGREITFTCGREGEYDRAKISLLLTVLAPFVTSGSIRMYNEKINHRYLFLNAEYGWAFEKGQIIYDRQALIKPFTVKQAATA